MSPNQMHRIIPAIDLSQLRADYEIHAASVRCRQQLRALPAGCDQQGRHETRSPFTGAFCDSDTLLPGETDGYGFEAAYVRPVPRWERIAMRLLDGCTPIRIALAVTYVAALSVVAGVTWGGWQ